MGMLGFVVRVQCALAIFVCGVDAQAWATVGQDIAYTVDEITGKTSLRPLANISHTMQVNLDMNIAAIIGLDEANGYLEISGYLIMNWTAEAYPPTTTTPITSGVQFALFETTQFWRPSIVVLNAIQTIDISKSNTDAKIRYNFIDRQCVWTPWIIVKAACTPNVQYYPFDKQTCKVTLAAWGYSSSELVLTPMNSEITKHFFEENGEWEITGTSATSRIEGGSSVVDFEIKLSRRPLYYVINLLSPIVVLGVLNVFVFVLPAESGERIGFSVTCFLAYVVLLNTVMAYLPTSAAPLSYLSYYTFVMMMFSAGITLATIFTLRMHMKANNDDAPPYWVVILCNCLRCWCCRFLCKLKVEPQKSNMRSRPRYKSSSDGQEVALETISSPDMGYWDDDKLSVEDEDDAVKDATSWKTIAKISDIVLFLGFLAAQVFYSTAYLLPMYFVSD